MSATLQTYPFHSTIESSSTDAEFLCRLGGVAVCPRQRAAQESPFRVSERGGFFATEDIRSRAAAPETRVGQFEPMPCSEGRADDQIVPINGQQGCIAAWQIGIDDPVRGEMRAKDAALDPASGILHDLLNEHSHRGAVVVAAVRDIQGADKLAGRIAHRRIHAAYARIPAGEVFISMDRDRSTLDQAGADPVRAFPAFAPHSAGRQADPIEKLAVTREATRFQNDTVIVRQHHGATRGRDDLEQLVEQGTRDLQHQLTALPPLNQVTCRYKIWNPIGSCVETVL